MHRIKDKTKSDHSISIPDIDAASPVGILAGTGVYPFLLAQRLIASGFEVVVAGIRGHFSGNLPPECGPFRTFPLGALEATARFFRQHHTTRIFMAGGVTRQGALRSLKPDRHALLLLPKALFGGDDRLLRGVADVMDRCGVRVCDPSSLIADLFAPAGLLAGPDPDEATVLNIKTAFAAARNLGRRDKGQAALVFQNKVIGIEDRKGTNALITRASKPGAILAKVVKPGQDPRFDMPAIGPSTAHLAHTKGLAAIAIEAHGVLLLELDRLLDICNRQKISLVGYPTFPNGPVL